MSIFGFGNKRATKMFISELPIFKEVSMQNQVVSKGIISTVVAQKIIEIAPELVQEGFKLFSSTIASFTQEYISETIVHKNIDGDSKRGIFLPSSITIVRANFPKDINSKKNNCFDGYGNTPNSCKELSDRKLHIELDIIKSLDEDSFYFQPSSYFYCGKDNSRKRIDELNLYFAFVTADENISDWNSIKFQKIISFKELEDEYDYNFKIDKDRYDTSYQSPWIGSELSKKGAYTMIFKIEEKRYSKPFAKTLNKIYKNHEDELQKRINQEIREQLKK